jgi:hypothetical protein
MDYKFRLWRFWQVELASQAITQLRHNMMPLRQLALRARRSAAAMTRAVLLSIIFNLIMSLAKCDSIRANTSPRDRRLQGVLWCCCARGRLSSDDIKSRHRC